MNTQPVPVPMLTNILVDAIHEANVAEGKRPKAFDTFTRHSSAGHCERQIALQHLDYPETDPPDLADQWVMWLGTVIHGYWQEAAQVKYGPDCEVEVPVRHGDLSSGHLDALIVTPEGVKITYELKTKGSFGFDNAVGLMRKKWFRKDPEGPKLAEVLQGSLNALASGSDLLIIGIVGLEAMSKGYADKMELTTDLERVMAEWHYSREEFEPLALAELQRLEEVKAWVDQGDLPPRWGLDDHGYNIVLNPARNQFPCSYCRHRQLCIFAGEQSSLPIPGYREWLKGDLAGLLEASVYATD